MYLTGGQYKGCKIEVPKSAKPTLSKVRQSVFNILVQYDINNKFLDMFAGSAIMGLEALSRGYYVKELEFNSKAAQIIKKNYAKLNLKPDLVICDSLKFKNEKFDVIYLDPPWDMDYEKIIAHSKTLLEQNGIIIVEHDANRNIDIQKIANSLRLEVIKSKKYGRCLIDLLR